MRHDEHMSAAPQCDKTAYNSKGAALAGAARFAGRYNASRLRVYFCRACTGWHLTSKVRAPQGGAES